MSHEEDLFRSKSSRYEFRVTGLGFLLKEFHSETEISAPLELVWKVVADLASYREWNPFTTEAEGELRVGCKLRMSYTTPGGENWRKYADKKVNVRNTKVISVIPCEEWSHHGGIPLLLSVTATFRLVKVEENKTRFIQHGAFSGLASRFLSEEFIAGGLIGIQETGLALKKRVEKTSLPSNYVGVQEKEA